MDERGADVDDWRFIEFDELGGWIRGRGPNHLVMLHGGPGLSDYTDAFGNLLVEELGSDWTVVRFQQRGLEPSTTAGPFTIEQQVADVVRVGDSLTSEPFTLVGHSWGGHLAMHAAVVAPHRFRALAIVDPLGAVPDGGMAAMGEHFTAHLTPDEAAARARLEDRAAIDGPTDELGIADLAIVWPYYFADPAAAPPMPPIRLSLDAHLGLFASVAKHFKAETLVHGLRDVSTPTLFVAATMSPIPHAESERSAALMPAAEVVTIPTGHFTWMEAPRSTISLITAFLRNT